MKLNSKNVEMVGTELETGLAGTAMAPRGRFTTVSTGARCLTGNDDLTHAWDGWLFAFLAVCAAWPILNALGVFN